jgi:hypothetical protein
MAKATKAPNQSALTFLGNNSLFFILEVMGIPAFFCGSNQQAA